MDLKTRAQNIVTRPAAEWPIIASESTGVAELITGYAAPLAAIPALCSFLGFSLIGVGVPGLASVRIGFFSGIVNAVVGYVFALVGLYVGALIIEKLAKNFQSHGDTAQALKVVMYSMTPAWIAGVLYLVPALSPLVVIASLYAIYLFYLGLPHVMHTPENQVIPYMVVSALVVIVVTVCLGFIATMLTGVGRYGF